MTYEYKTTPFDHQRRIFEETHDVEAYALLWEQGCVDADTEYLGPSGWRKISEYKSGKVAQWHPDTGVAEFVEPVEYVRLPCSEMLHFKTKYGIDQVLSPEHRVPVYNKTRTRLDVVRADELEKTLQAKTFRQLPATFTMRGGVGMELTEDQLRLQVAVMADGSFPRNAPYTRRCSVRLKKRRKIKRLDKLLRALDMDFKLRIQKDGFYCYTFEAPLRCKTYERFMGVASTREMKIVADEVFHWNGTHRSNGAAAFFSIHECDADFIQLALAAQGEIVRKYYYSGLYTVYQRSRGTNLTIRSKNIERISSPDGHKYCFVVPSTFLLFRRNGCIFPSGNTGKTKPIIDTAASLYERGEIDALLVVAPNGVHRNWVTDELPVHMPDRVMKKTHCMFWRSPKADTKWHAAAFQKVLKHNGLAILTVSFNGFMTKRGKAAVWKFLRHRRCLYVIDESHHVKTPKAKRTRSVIASGKYATYRRVLTGTPGDKPFDIYSQLRFLDPDLWHRHQMGNFQAFKTYFAEWFTRSEAKAVMGYDPGYDKLLRYKNLDELNKILMSMSDRVLKEDVLDLPPKLYTKRYFDMTPKQSRMYNQLRDELELELANGLIIDGTMAIVRLLRLQQITCGYAVADSDEPIEMCDKKNPRLDAAVDFFTGLNHQAIVWARFTHDIDQLVDALPGAIRYDGAIDDEQAARNKDAFNAGDAAFLVGNPAKGAEGITLNVAKTTGFYSNSFKLLQRLQAEDRNHRIGQDGADHGEYGYGVLYADFCAVGTVDVDIIKSLRDKFDIAALITGDRLRQWI